MGNKLDEGCYALALNSSHIPSNVPPALQHRSAGLSHVLSAHPVGPGMAPVTLGTPRVSVGLSPQHDD